MACPVDYIAVPALAVAGAAAGATRSLLVKPGYFERPALYVAVCGPVGSAKSPALDLVDAPLRLAEDGLHRQYLAELREHEDDPDAARSPKRRSVYVSDVTREQLAVMLQENPRGLIQVLDELKSLFSGMDQYRQGGKGADKQFYLSAWSGKSINVQRRNPKSPPVWVMHPCLAVAGCITPDELRKVPSFLGGGDGLAERFLFAYPEPLPAVGEKWVSTPQELLDDWTAALATLRELEPAKGEDDAMHPVPVPLEAEARDWWACFTGQLAAEVNAADFPPHLRGVWAKFRSYGPRLALVVQLLRYAYREAKLVEVERESMWLASDLLEYFGNHARRAFGLMATTPALQLARRLLAWICQNQHKTFSQRDAYRALRSPGLCDKPADAYPAYDLLAEHNCIRAPEPEQGTARERGRPSSQVYEVNPAVLEDPANLL
jgi:hypothetical protein